MNRKHTILALVALLSLVLGTSAVAKPTVVAIDQLMARRDHLENYGDKARFALADSYDRATQAQARREAE